MISISQRLIELIEQNAGELADRLMADLLSRKETRHYKNIPEDRTRERVYDVYRRLGSWLSREKSMKEEREKYYTELGKQRCKENIPLHEVVIAFMLIKRHIWLYVIDKHIIDSAFELQRALDLNNRVVLFFDRVIFFIVKGYEEELRKASVANTPSESENLGFFAWLFSRKK